MHNYYSSCLCLLAAFFLNFPLVAFAEDFNPVTAVQLPANAAGFPSRDTTLDVLSLIHI